MPTEGLASSPLTNVKAASLTVLRVIALAIILFVCFAVAGGVVGLPNNSPPSERAGSSAAALLVVCLLDTLVLTYLILRSRWAGWRLMATVFLVFYGVMTFMSQIESAAFVTHLPAGALPRLFLMGVLVAAPFSVLAVLILGKRKANSVNADPGGRSVIRGGWAWNLTVIALAYLILYFTFGYFIAWRNPVVRVAFQGR